MNTLVTDLVPDRNVLRAMNDIETKKRERAAALERQLEREEAEDVLKRHGAALKSGMSSKVGGARDLLFPLLLSSSVFLSSFFCII